MGNLSTRNAYGPSRNEAHGPIRKTYDRTSNEYSPTSDAYDPTRNAYDLTRNAYGPTRTTTALLETGTAILETGTALQEKRTTLQNFVFYKMSDENEHSDSRFYYPVGLSDTEVHVRKLPTCPKNRGKRVKVFANEEQEMSFLKMLID